ncbi:uncharacterized protein CDAR_564871 [Caerostris darwini]|uniref:Neuroligin n=1 Tax=Caerostris darwini TaxID=1538125 RepID=A0AAV4QAN0_9ARAC|nr:uncharacterized protein CDAR_564871 [Caerostris darwini]
MGDSSFQYPLGGMNKKQTRGKNTLEVKLLARFIFFENVWLGNRCVICDIFSSDLLTMTRDSLDVAMICHLWDPNITPNQELERSTTDKSKARFEKLSWIPYETVHQKFLLIGLKPKIRDHYRAHRLSFWLNLIPQLHRPGTASVIPQHHLLDDHNNPLTYDGIVRPFADDDDVSAAVFGPLVSGPEQQILSTMDPDFLKNVTALATSSGVVSTKSPTGNNQTNTTAIQTKTMMVEDNAYTTALTITVSVGSSLLLLNVLIFFGVYYQRDKNRREKKKMQDRKYKEGNAYGTDAEEPVDEESFQHQTHGDSDKDSTIDREKYNLWEFEVRHGNECESIVMPGQSKPSAASGSSALAICPPTLPPDYTHHHHQIIHPTQQGVRMLPPKVPPKPVIVPPAATDSTLPEAQPLLPHCGILKQTQAPPKTQEMAV